MGVYLVGDRPITKVLELLYMGKKMSEIRIEDKYRYGYEISSGHGSLKWSMISVVYNFHLNLYHVIATLVVE